LLAAFIRGKGRRKLNKILPWLVCAAALIGGFFLGRITAPAPPVPIEVVRESIFRQCMAKARDTLPELARESRNAPKLPRARFVLGAMSEEFDCAQMSDIGGLDLTELHEASGYAFNAGSVDHLLDQ
jgi:hypothetical protein